MLGFIALATYFLNEFIAMSMLAKRRKKRAFDSNSQYVTDVLEGKKHLDYLVHIFKIYFSLSTYST